MAVVSTEDGEIYKNITSEFEKLWNDVNHTEDYEDFIEEYRTRYKAIKEQRRIAAENNPVVSMEQYKLSPNTMQVGFINNLKALIDQGENKALLISATGSYVIIVTKSEKAYKYLLSSLCPFS